MVLDDDGLVGVTQLVTTPWLLLSLLFSYLLLVLKNIVIDVCYKLVIRKFADLSDWYADIQEKLSFEEYEDPKQTFSITQFGPLFAHINSSNIRRTLRLINRNMMKVPKTEALEQILDKINTQLDYDRRSLVSSSL